LGPPNAYSLLNSVLTGAMNWQALASNFPGYGPNTGASYQWVQLISEDVREQIFPNLPSYPIQGKVICAEVKNHNAPLPPPPPTTLDNGYPYGVINGVKVGTVTTTNVNTPNDTAVDAPTTILVDVIGEFARNINATMYLMYIPPILTGCPTIPGQPCTIPVPLGTFQWYMAGDVINTMQTKLSQLAGGFHYSLWTLNGGTGPGNPTTGLSQGFLTGSTFPTWATTARNTDNPPCVPPNLYVP